MEETMSSNSTDLEAIQRAMEQEAIDLGIARYNRRLEAEGDASSKPGLTLIREILLGTETSPGLVARIDEALNDAAKGNPGRAAHCYHFLEQFSAEEIALITVRQALVAMAKNLSLQRASNLVSKALEDTRNVLDLKALSPGLYKAYLRVARKKSRREDRIILMRRQKEQAQIALIRWGHAERLKVGHFLLHLLAECTPQLVEFGTSMGEFGRPGPLVVRPTAWTQAWLRESHLRCSLLAPVYLPMVVKPKPWTAPFGGGYLTEGLNYCLVKKARGRVIAALKRHSMPTVYAAVNALQDTEWAINKGVYSVVRDLWDSGGGRCGLPTQDNLPLPPRDFPADAKPDDPALLTWKAQASKVYDTNAKMVSQRLSVMCKLDLAERMSKFDRIYFPHALDWRGRAYPVPSHLTPQSDDLGKALLQFANGVPLGSNGAFWLAVHGSNCYGVDKVSYDDRVQWVQDHEEDILAAGIDPLYHQGFWSQADSPWQFLAFCREWAGLVTHHRAGKPTEEYVSHLAVGLDGSCNGLQQFSALLLDEVGGKATNLIPSDKPSDIYAAVAQVAQRMIDEKAAQGDEIAQRWVGRITRKLTKRNTMTVPYGVTQLGMRDQLWAEFRKLRDEAIAAGRDGAEWEVPSTDCMFLAQVNYQAIGQVVIAARAAQDWLREVAKIASGTGKAIHWVTPSGMLVVQDYRAMVGRRISTFMTGTRQELMLTLEGDKLDPRKMGLGISPNFVHSLDASHLHSTVVAGLKKGLKDFAMIHDSYGAHAGLIDVLAATLRETFVEQYTGDLLADYKRQLEEQLPEVLRDQLPPLPAKGSLELSLVLESDYFFA